MSNVEYKVTIKLEYSNVVMRGPDLQTILHKVDSRYEHVMQKLTVEAYHDKLLVSTRVVYDRKKDEVQV